MLILKSLNLFSLNKSFIKQILRKINIKYLSTTTSTNFSSLIKKSNRNQQLKQDEQELLLIHMLTNKKDNWDEIEISILSTKGRIKQQNFDTAIINYCTKLIDLNLAKSYVQYLKSKNKSLSRAAVGRLLRLYFYTYSKESDISDQVQDEIMILYNELTKESENLMIDTISAESAILGICLTKNWKQSLVLLDNIRSTSIPPTLVLSAISGTAFRNCEENLGWKLMKDIVDDGNEPNDLAYFGLFDFCEQNKTVAIISIEKLVVFFSENYVRPSLEVAEKLALFLIKFGGNCQKTFIRKSTQSCNICENSLRPSPLTSDEFNKLKRNFYQKVLIGNNLFTKTTPKEIEKFHRFIESVGSHDIVIDGLNVAYSCGNRQNSGKFGDILAKTVNYFLKFDKKVIVLGRNHMTKWPKFHMDFIYKYASVFFTENISQDDPFLLYAAMHNGPNTGIVSRDLMRGHAFKLKNDPHLFKLFKKWQAQNQYRLAFFKNDGSPEIKHPLPYFPEAQKNGNCWHIPIDDSKEIEEKSPPNQINQTILNPVSKFWLCATFDHIGDV